MRARNLFFQLSPNENIKTNEWRKTHKKYCNVEDSAIGGRFRYIFIPTSLGTIKEIECICGQKFVISDSNEW